MLKEHKTLVRETWNRVLPIAGMASELFYRRLFEIDPTIRDLFARVDMNEQRHKLIVTLTAAVNGLDELESLIPVVEDLGRRHASYGVRDAHYESVGSALLWTLEQGLGASWTPRTAQAWSAVYGALSDIMRAAAADVGDSSGLRQVHQA